MPKGKPKKSTVTQKTSNQGYLERLETEVQSNQSRLSMILGALILLVLGILLFNYFNRPKPEIGPSQQTSQEQQQQQPDVTPENLPGKYTVKEGDTLFLIAEKYYKDGDKFTEIVKANNLVNADLIEVGQTLDIPRFEAASFSPAFSPTPEPTLSPSPNSSNQPTDTQWGPAITGNTYTVEEGDWLSKIAARAYGDIFAYKKLAQTNNIPDPNFIVPGMMLIIPR